MANSNITKKALAQSLKELGSTKILLDFKIGVEGLLTAYPEIFFIVYVILTN